jgi:transcription elongation factor
MTISARIGGFITDSFFKVVDVELADEGGEVAVLEILREDILGKSRRVSDREGVTVVFPGNKFRRFVLE